MNIALPVSFCLFPFLGLLVYWCCLTGEPIFDDLQLVAATSKYKWRWRFVLTRQRPLTALGFALQKSWPNTMRGLHVGNVLIHSASAMLCERIALKLGFDLGLAFFAALCYLVLPFAVNSVAYVTGRASLLSGFFGMAAALAVISGYAWLAFPFLLLAVVSKEDAVGFLAQSAALMLWYGDYRTFAVLAGLSLAGALYCREYLHRMWTNTGDNAMAVIHLPVAYRQPLHGLTVLTETLRRLPLWAIGAASSPWHGGGIGFSWKRAVIVVVAIIGGLWLYLYS